MVKTSVGLFVNRIECHGLELYRVRSFNLKTINTLRGTFRRISKTDISNPSLVMTAFRIASTSCSVWGNWSNMLDARLKVDGLSFSGCGSSAVSPMLARPWEFFNLSVEDARLYSPVNAASNIGY